MMRIQSSARTQRVFFGNFFRAFKGEVFRCFCRSRSILFRSPYLPNRPPFPIFPLSGLPSSSKRHEAHDAMCSVSQTSPLDCYTLKSESLSLTFQEVAPRRLPLPAGERERVRRNFKFLWLVFEFFLCAMPFALCALL